MSTRTDSYLDAVEHLPSEAVLVLHDVTWDEYEQLLEDMNAWPGKRVTYFQGRVEIVGSSLRHERAKICIGDLVTAFCDVRGIEMENYGSTVIKRKRDEQGAEPDVCFYVRNLEEIASKDGPINPDLDPVPDVTVEVDISYTSPIKFQIYANFQVPELWRYDKKGMRFYRLSGNEYLEIGESLAFPGLTAAVLGDFVEQCKTKGRTAGVRVFRQWVQNIK
jgi:Uma2 family endonuclease